MEVMEKCRSKLSLAKDMIKQKKRLDASENLVEIINDLKRIPDQNQRDENLLEAHSTLADLLDDMGEYQDSLKAREDAIILAGKLFKQPSQQVTDQMIKKANTTWTLFDKQEEKSAILNYAKATATSIGQMMKGLRNLEDYPERSTIMKDFEQKLHCVLMVMDASAKIDEMTRKIPS